MIVTMKTKIIIITCIGILFIVLFMTRSTGVVNHTSEKTTQSSHHQTQPRRLNDQPNHLFYFVQISDIHISIFKDQTRISDFRNFVHETLDIIKPPVVVASGDLTDARGKDLFISQQYDDEWKTYNDILLTANVPNRTKWLDIRGNHDNFNVPLSMIDNSHFKRYSIQGGRHKRSYMELVKDFSGNKYAFIAVDACLEPGPKRPYNFVGLLTQNDTDHLQHLVDESRKAGVNYTIWFGHYPTTCIVTRNKENRSIKRIIADDETSLAYLCGHLHSLAGLVPRMYALQENRFFELEVADWKECRKYRVAAIDHGILSFVDTEYGVWPIILITNPKNTLFHIPHRKETKVQLESTHVRILAFSPAGIKSCEVKIDNNFHEKCHQVSRNLFVVPWDPERYRNGLHSITVTVVDSDGRKNEVKQPFRLDDKQSLFFDFWGQFVLHTDAITIFKSIFWFILFLCVFPLIFLRIWHELVKAGYLIRMRSTCRTSMSVVQHYWLVASVDRIFWPVVLYCFYLAVGPWVFCEIVDGSYGFVFIWGIYFNGVYLPGSQTYLYGAAQLLLCKFPLIWIYSKCLAKRYYEVIGMPVKKHRGWSRNLSRTLFYFIISLEVGLTIFFGFLYGIVAFLLAVFRTWSVILNIYLYYLARKVPEHCLRPAINAWGGNDKPLNANDQSNQNNETHTN